MMEKLTYRNVITIKDRYNTEGHSPLRVIADDFNPYVLKFPNNPYDNASIINEFLCHYFLKCWSIPTPDIAGLKIPPDVLKGSSCLTSRDKRLIGDNISFGSQMILEPVELIDFVKANNSTAQKRITNAFDIFKIALFDIWVENDDRRPTNNNILLEPVGKNFILNPIDHAFTFSSINYSELTYSTVNFSVNDSILFSPLATSIVKKTSLNTEFYTNLEKIFYLCIEKSKNEFPYITDLLPDNLILTKDNKTLLHNFLFNSKRVQLVWEEFNYIINRIK